MRIDVELIDAKGFWHKKTALSKSLFLKWLESLPGGAEVHWKGRKSVFVSLQYMQKENLSYEK